MPGNEYGNNKFIVSVSFSSTSSPNVQVNHKTVARAITRDGIVLLKNKDNALPLKKPVSLAVMGYEDVLNPQGANACVDRKCDDGALAMVCSLFSS